MIHVSWKNYCLIPYFFVLKTRATSQLNLQQYFSNLEQKEFRDEIKWHQKIHVSVTELPKNWSLSDLTEFLTSSKLKPTSYLSWSVPKIIFMHTKYCHVGFDTCHALHLIKMTLRSTVNIICTLDLWHLHSENFQAFLCHLQMDEDRLQNVNEALPGLT